MQSSRSFTVRLVLRAPLTFLALAPFAVTPLAASAAQVSGEQTFDIPSGPLGRVLNEFSRQAGVYLVGSHELAQNHQSDGLRGRHSIQQGLEHLLRGTGLQAVRQGASGYVLQPGSAVDVVQLQPMSVIGAEVQDANGQSDAGYRAIQSATASKTNTSVLEIPRSISVVTRRRMDDQKSQTLTEVLGYVPGIFAPPFAAGDGQAGDLFFIRGFNATDYGYGLLRDGLRGPGKSL